jgi:hypothetical protein
MNTANGLTLGLIILGMEHHAKSAEDSKAVDYVIRRPWTPSILLFDLSPKVDHAVLAHL